MTKQAPHWRRIKGKYYPAGRGRAKPLQVKRVPAPRFRNEQEYMKYHCTRNINEDAYSGDDYYGDKIENNPVLLKVIMIEGKSVELRQSGEKNRYCRVDSKHEIIRDKKGLATYMSEAEIKARNLPLYDEAIIAYHNKEPIGFASNEFGATGVFVHPDWRRKGLGLALLTEYRKQIHPSKRLGQMTGAGYELARKYYRTTQGGG